MVRLLVSQFCTILQTDIRPAKPQKLQLRVRVPPDLTQLAVHLQGISRALGVQITRHHHRRRRENRTRKRYPINRSQIDVALGARQTAQAPDVQVDCGLDQKVVMGLQLDVGCCRTGAGFGRVFVLAVLITDVTRGLCRRSIVVVVVGDGDSDGDRRVGEQDIGRNASLTHTTTMSKAPTLLTQLAEYPPELVFTSLLEVIKASPPQIQLIKVKPHLSTFLSHPTIKELIREGDAPAPPSSPPSDNLDLQKIQESLSSLTKAVEDLKKASPTSNKTSPPKLSKQKEGVKSTHSPLTYSAVAGSRPPNPSLVVDLAKFGTDKGTWVKPEVLCHTLNERLSQISPPQVQLATVRWTAKGNLIITGSPTSSPQSLQAAAMHISAAIPSIFPHLSSTPIPQPRANVKWSKILINGVVMIDLKILFSLAPQEVPL